MIVLKIMPSEAGFDRISELFNLLAQLKNPHIFFSFDGLHLDESDEPERLALIEDITNELSELIG